jgi:hypothetical protein
MLCFSLIFQGTRKQIRKTNILEAKIDNMDINNGDYTEVTLAEPSISNHGDNVDYMGNNKGDNKNYINNSNVPSNVTLTDISEMSPYEFMIKYSTFFFL